MAKVKYLGLSDVRRLDKGENFGGRLAEGLSNKVEWTPENNHLIDTDEVGLSSEALELLLDEKDDQGRPEFKDVSGLKTIPTSLHEQTFRGLGVRASNEVADGDAVQTSGATDGAGATVGGSTATARGAGRGSATTSSTAASAPVGGSTSGNG